MFFVDRREAGRKLAAKLVGKVDDDTVVLGLPRGGVVVAAEVAKVLQLPLDVIVARKIPAPRQPELAIGAVGAHGGRVLDEHILRYVMLPPGYLEDETLHQQSLVREREARLRGVRPAEPLAGRPVILVDDGVATGMTMLAAIQEVRTAHPRRVTVAAPVIAPSTLPRLEATADGVVAIATPSPFDAVGMFYLDFGQTTDDEVMALLRSSAEGTTPAR